MNPQALQDALSEQPTNDLLGKGYGPILKDGSGLRELLNKNIKKEITTFTQKGNSLNVLSDDERKTYNTLKSNISKQSFDLKMIDLAILHKLDSKKFKDLLVVAVDKETESLRQFSSVDQTQFIKKWLQAIGASQDIIKKQKSTVTGHDLETFSNVFEMGLEWKDKQHKTIEPLTQEVEISDLQDEKIIRRCIENIEKLLKNPGMVELINRSHERHFKIGPEDLKTIKTFDGSRDYSIINNNEGEATIYSNISVVDATLASAALPLVLQDVQINGRRFADGGQLNNMPYDIIGKGEETLVLGFADGNMEKAVHSGSQEKIFSKGTGRRIIEAILRFIGLCIKKDNGLIKNKDLGRIREEKALSTIVNNVKEVSTTDFGRAYSEKDEGLLRGYLSTMNHLILYNYHPEAQKIMSLQFQLENGENTNKTELHNRAKVFQKFTDNF